MINFSKAVGTGNDFIVIDNRENIVKDPISLTKRMCKRKHSVGADGVLLLEKSSSSDFKMRIINPDGSEVSMCGNGARCAAMYAFKNTWVKEYFSIETDAGILEAAIIEGQVKLKMTDPVDLEQTKDILINSETINGYFINTGVEHFISFVDDIENVQVKKTGKEIRDHETFTPAGTNANFVKVIGDNDIIIRTYERGVEDETLACGTGATASAIMANIVKGVRSPVNVLTRSGEYLKIYFNVDGDQVTEVYMQGPARIVYNGTIDI